MKTSVALAALMVLSVSAWSQGPNQGKGEPKSAQEKAASDQRGTENAPLVVEVLPPKDADLKAADDKKEREEKADSDRWLVRITGALALIGALQLWVFGRQALRLRQSVEAATKQSSDMEKSIAESTRAANAMELVAKELSKSVIAAENSVATMRERTAAQSRAYLTIKVGNALAQDATNHVRFEVRPFLINAGMTPAHGVRYRARAAILDVPIPANFVLPEIISPWVGAAVVGPHQEFVISAVVDDFVAAPMVEIVRRGVTRAACIWGTVQYRDVFGEEHYTNFCQSVRWMDDGRIYGSFAQIHNDAN